MPTEHITLHFPTRQEGSVSHWPQIIPPFLFRCKKKLKPYFIRSGLGSSRIKGLLVGLLGQVVDSYQIYDVILENIKQNRTKETFWSSP